MKKSQMEIIGLVVIVILISIAMLFALQFSLKPKTEEKEAYTNAQLASNTINALLKTKPEDCYQNNTISELLKDCIEVSDDNKRICANQTINSMITNTLISWQKNFRFVIADPNNNLIINMTNGICRGSVEASPPYLISTNQGYIVARLEICS